MADYYNDVETGLFSGEKSHSYEFAEKEGDRRHGSCSVWQGLPGLLLGTFPAADVPVADMAGSCRLRCSSAWLCAEGLW